jgi:AbiU2
MAAYRTSEEVRAEHIAKMGDQLGKAYNALYNELAWLFIKWRQYEELFGKKPERIDLLNEAAPLFFRLLQDTLWEDILLHVARLTDAVASRGKENLTVRQLPLLVEPALQAETEALVKAAVEKAEFAADWRKRHIAHRDLKRVLAEKPDQLAPASRLKVKQVLESLAAIMNRVDQHYFGSETAYDFGPDYGDAVSLFYVLRNGLEAEHARRRRLEAGEPLNTDIGPPREV